MLDSPRTAREPVRLPPQTVSDTCHALASPQRVEIVRILSAATPDPNKTCCGPEEICACKIAERLGIAQSTVSHHMGVLAAAGIVTTRRDGKWTYYTLQRERLRALAQALTSF